ncbi:radical SAM protein [Candidatus Wolfebacteria bacterium]|nr:radical SAM protein [Candidatus Wolfebacteria bacterium]
MKVNAMLLLIKSKFLQVARDKQQVIIWHSLFGYPMSVSKTVLEIIDFFKIPRTFQSVFDEYEYSDNLKVVVNELIDHYFLVPVDFNERNILAQKNKNLEQSIASGALINYLELIVSEECNFRCLPCIHFSNLKTTDRSKIPKKFMDFKVAKNAVDYFISLLRKHNKKVAEINFGGGEPLLAWPEIERVCEYCINTYGLEFDILFSLNTNASLITAEIAKKLRDYKIKIASSLDGLKEGNNCVRLTKSGKGTFSAILNGFDTLAAQKYPIDGFTVTVSEGNFKFINEKIIDWAAGRKMSEVRIDIDVIGMVGISVENIVGKLMRIRRYAQKQGIEVFGFWSRPVENLNESVLETQVSFCGAVRGSSICVSPSGDIYGCGYSRARLGTLDEKNCFCIQGGQYYNFIKNRFSGAMEMCKGCMIEGQCGGGCQITQEFAKTNRTEKVERMCDFYRCMTQELLFEQLH